MQFEQLSDHAGDQLQTTETRHNEAQRYAQHSGEQVIRADADYRDAWRARPLWRRVLGVATPEVHDAEQRLAAAQRQSSEARELVSDWKNVVDQQGAGVAGERDLASWLDSTLSDEWVGFGGYRNKKGEADLVLVGPSGVWVVEVKNRNARVFAHGDQWRYEKVDKYGNVVDSGPATDRSGRTWGQQASHVAESLGWWLGHNQIQVPVRTAVVLVHPNALIGASTSPGVDVLSANKRDLFLDLAYPHGILGPDVRKSVAKLIRRDHAHHQRRQMRNRNRRSGPRRS